MSIIDTLITDRTQADVTKLKSLLSKPKAMWTNEEWSEFLLAKDKGAYNATDLNRVQEAMEYLAERFRGYGYNVPEIKRPSITEVIPGTSRLPEGYTELEYIQSTGTQYVDTLFKPNSNTKFVVDLQISNNKCHVFGARTSYLKKALCLYWQSNSAAAIQVGNTQFNAGAFAETARHQVTMTATELYMDGNLQKSYSTDDFQCEQNAWLMSCYASSESEYASGKLYSCQIYDNDTLVRDYVPCLNPSKEVGLYDIVNGVFYGNAGTGYFLPGPAMTLPEGYTRLDYIQSTGAQYIDIDFCPNQDTRAVLDFQNMDTSKRGWLFGVQPSWANAMFDLCLYEGSLGLHTGYGTKSDTITGFTADARYVVDKNKNNTTIDGISSTLAANSFQTTISAIIFARRTTSVNADIFASAKLYSCQIYDNDILTRLYTPCRNADGVAGLYDSITGAFFGNAGTGVFVAGEELGGSGDVPSQTVERDYWEIGDIPRRDQMNQYLANLRTIRGLNDVMKSTPAAPSDMELLTHDEANDIEQILTDVDYLLSVMVLGWFYTAEVFCGEV